MQYTALFIQLFLATVMAVPIAKTFANGAVGQTSLSPRSIFVKREENSSVQKPAEKLEIGVTDPATTEIEVKANGIDVKQNLACEGCCDECGGCPEESTCVCPKIPCPCDWCGHLKCLCPCSLCGKLSCGGECEPACKECGETSCVCPKLPCPCDACSLLDCICPCKLCGSKDCKCESSSCGECDKTPCVCPKLPCPCGLLDCLSSKKPCKLCGEPEPECDS